VFKVDGMQACAVTVFLTSATALHLDSQPNLSAHDDRRQICSSRADASHSPFPIPDMTSHNEPWRVISGNFRTRVLVRAGQWMCLMHGNRGRCCSLCPYSHAACMHVLCIAASCVTAGDVLDRHHNGCARSNSLRTRGRQKDHAARGEDVRRHADCRHASTFLNALK
jgi:hypothetical protein